MIMWFDEMTTFTKIVNLSKQVVIAVSTFHFSFSSALAQFKLEEET
jgi:predicted transcriptional regulator